MPPGTHTQSTSSKNVSSTWSLENNLKEYCEDNASMIPFAESTEQAG